MLDGTSVTIFRAMNCRGIHSLYIIITYELGIKLHAQLFKKKVGTLSEKKISNSRVPILV